ncbi:Csa1 family protein, partial [Staphylococcus epidermidis]
MKHSRRLIVFASFLILTFFISGCGSMTKEG